MAAKIAVRRFPRVATEHPVSVRLLGEPEPSVGTFTTRVMGLGGCSLLSSEPLGYRSLVDVVIDLPERPLRADGRVTYELSAGPGRYEVGVEFLRLLPEDRQRLEQMVAQGPLASC